MEDALQALERVHGLVKLEREHELPNGVLSQRYQFVHVLYQNALNASLSPSPESVMEWQSGGRFGSGLWVTQKNDCG